MVLGMVGRLVLPHGGTQRIRANVWASQEGGMPGEVTNRASNVRVVLMKRARGNHLRGTGSKPLRYRDPDESLSWPLNKVSPL